MLRRMSKIALSLISAFALSLAVTSVCQACFFCVHQPDIPDGLKKFEE